MIITLPGYTLCRLEGTAVLHIRPPDPAGRAPRYELHELTIGPLCAGDKAHPDGCDVAGQITDVVLESATPPPGRRAGCCLRCAEEYRRRFAIFLEESRAASGSRWKYVPDFTGTAALVHDVRDVLRMSQARLAEVLAVSYVTVSRWENNHNVPRQAHWQMMKVLLEAIGDRAWPVLRKLPVVEMKERVRHGK